MDWQRWLGLEASDDEEDLTRRHLLGPRKRALLTRRQSQSHHWCLLPSIAVLAAVLAWSVLDAYFTHHLELTRVYVPAPLPRPPPAPPSQEGRWVQRAAPPPVREPTPWVPFAGNDEKPAYPPSSPTLRANGCVCPTLPHSHAHAGEQSGGRTAGDCCRTTCSSGCARRRRSGCGRPPWQQTTPRCRGQRRGRSTWTASCTARTCTSVPTAWCVCVCVCVCVCCPTRLLSSPVPLTETTH
jgi:hypothetical protein